MQDAYAYKTPKVPQPRPALAEGAPVTISGVALLAICTLLGVLLGDLLGVALGVKANVGGVGIAMIFLIAARLWLMRRGLLSHGLKGGGGVWGSFYIPIVVALAAPQKVGAAGQGGPSVVNARIGAGAGCFSVVGPIRRPSGP